MKTITTALEDALSGQPHRRPLSPREIMVMDHMQQGHTIQEIAPLLGISEETVKQYLKRIRVKLRMVSGDQAALVAVYEAVYRS